VSITQLLVFIIAEAAGHKSQPIEYESSYVGQYLSGSRSMFLQAGNKGHRVALRRMDKANAAQQQQGEAQDKAPSPRYTF
jgi:hypothetical protein